MFRPIPPHDRVIINPGSKTPLSLGIYGRTATIPTTTTYNYDVGFAAFPTSAAAASAPSPAESTFVVIAPGTKGTFAR
jgi:hypothetical protein